jgi:hypothetical protein
MPMGAHRLTGRVGEVLNAGTHTFGLRGILVVSVLAMIVSVLGALALS